MMKGRKKGISFTQKDKGKIWNQINKIKRLTPRGNGTGMVYITVPKTFMRHLDMHAGYFALLTLDVLNNQMIIKPIKADEYNLTPVIYDQNYKKNLIVKTPTEFEVESDKLESSNQMLDELKQEAFDEEQLKKDLENQNSEPLAEVEI